MCYHLNSLRHFAINKDRKTKVLILTINVGPKPVTTEKRAVAWRGGVLSLTELPTGLSWLMACLVLKEKNKIKQHDGNTEIMPLSILGGQGWLLF